MTRKIILLTATIISVIYCFRFGYIWSAYGHGGQILGIPFALLMLIMAVAYFSKKPSRGKEILFLLAIIYFMTLAAFSVSIELIRATKENYFGFLYEPGGYVDKILLSWVVFGAFASLVCFRKINQKYRLSNKHSS